MTCTFLFLGSVLYLIPNLTRRGILFAVPISPELRAGPLGRRSVAIFHGLVWCATIAAVLGVLLAPEPFLGRVSFGATLAILAAATVGFAWQYRRLAPFAVQVERPPLAREVGVSRDPERLPWFTWLGTGPFLIIAIAAVFLALNWSRIPARFPVHWGMNGLPDRWTERSFRGVYGPILVAAELCGWCLLSSLALWFGARRSGMRRAVMGAMIAAGYMFGIVFAAVAVNPVVKIPIWIPVVLPLALAIPLIIFMARKVKEDTGPVEPTPNECWKGGVIYYNPDDAALMVEKRLGLGYTFNFGNPWSWALLFGLLAVVGSVFLLL